MKFFILLLFTSLFIPKSYGEESLHRLFLNYQNGEEFCRAHEDVSGAEKGFSLKPLAKLCEKNGHARPI